MLKDKIRTCKELCQITGTMVKALETELYYLEYCEENAKTKCKESKYLSDYTSVIRKYAMDITKMVSGIQKQAWKEYAKEEKWIGKN